MWLYLVALVGLYHLVCWYWERQVVDQLKDKYVFITGCDSGFGNLLARQLDQKGLRVLAACLTENGAEKLRAQTSDRLDTVILDITKTESITAATQWVKEHTGDRGLWGLVNNAGILGNFGPNEWQTRQDFMKVLEVNLLGVIDVTLNLLPLLRKAQGRVVNVSSIAGRLAVGAGGYSISKFGIESFSDSLRRELSFFGVKVVVIEPGAFNTGMSGGSIIQSLRIAWNKVNAEVKDIYGEKFLTDLIRSYQSYKPKLDLTLVTDCMEHALISCHPRTRYSAGWDAKLILIPLSYMPTFLVDAFFKWKRELSFFGVKVAVIEPGPFKTELSHSMSISQDLQIAWNKASPEVKEIYGDKFLTNMIQSLQLYKAKLDLTLVTDCMEHALISCHPRTRYSAGWDGKFIYIPLSYMPTFLVDAFLKWNSTRPAKAM